MGEILDLGTDWVKPSGSGAVLDLGTDWVGPSQAEQVSIEDVATYFSGTPQDRDSMLRQRAAELGQRGGKVELVLAKPNPALVEQYMADTGMPRHIAEDELGKRMPALNLKVDGKEHYSLEHMTDRIRAHAKAQAEQNESAGGWAARAGYSAGTTPEAKKNFLKSQFKAVLDSDNGPLVFDGSTWRYLDKPGADAGDVADFAGEALEILPEVAAMVATRGKLGGGRAIIADSAAGGVGALLREIVSAALPGESGATVEGVLGRTAAGAAAAGAPSAAIEAVRLPARMGHTKEIARKLFEEAGAARHIDDALALLDTKAPAGVVGDRVGSAWSDVREHALGRFDAARPVFNALGVDHDLARAAANGDTAARQALGEALGGLDEAAQADAVVADHVAMARGVVDETAAALESVDADMLGKVFRGKQPLELDPTPLRKAMESVTRANPAMARRVRAESMRDLLVASRRGSTRELDANAIVESLTGPNGNRVAALFAGEPRAAEVWDRLKFGLRWAEKARLMEGPVPDVVREALRSVPGAGPLVVGSYDAIFAPLKNPRKLAETLVDPEKRSALLAVLDAGRRRARVGRAPVGEFAQALAQFVAVTGKEGAYSMLRPTRNDMTAEELEAELGYTPLPER